ncbi:MAG: conjugal transfer protein TraO, partial [Bacteroides sp.]|nr:conjugal transfer protein TraO [Bacteroides sp.]
MKKVTFLLALMLCLVVQNQAQAQRRLPSQKGIQLTGGTVNGFNFDT